MSTLKTENFESGSSLATLGAVAVIDCSNQSGAGLRGSTWGARGTGTASEKYYCEFSFDVTASRRFRIEADFDHADASDNGNGTYAFELRVSAGSARQLTGYMLSFYHGVGSGADRSVLKLFDASSAVTPVWTSTTGVIVPNTTQRLRICGELSTWDISGNINPDGTCAVYVDGTLLVSLTGLSIGTTAVGTVTQNQFDRVTYGPMGRLDNLAAYNDGCKLVGSTVFGVDTTVTAPRAIACGLDGTTNVHDEAGKLKVFGDFEVTGRTDLAGLARIVRDVVTLADANIKALPTTPFALVAAPGVGLTIVPSFVLLLANFTAGAYTNVNTDGFLFAQFGTDAWSGYIGNDSTNAVTYLDTFLGAANSRAVLREYQDTTDPTPQWGPLVVPGPRADNTALSLTIDNGGSGNLTGGNAANGMIAVVYYTVEAVP